MNICFSLAFLFLTIVRLPSGVNCIIRTVVLVCSCAQGFSLFRRFLNAGVTLSLMGIG